MKPYTQTPHKRKVICFFFLLPACYLENLNAHETSAMILETYFLSMTPPSLYPLKTILCFLWTEEHKHPEVAAVSLSLSRVCEASRSEQWPAVSLCDVQSCT